MRLRKTSSVEQLKTVNRFEGLRKALLAPQYAPHREKLLACWALPTDRRLPLALLSRTLAELLSVSFADLAGTPGIGQKKMASLVMLLGRAVQTEPAELAEDPAGAATGGNGRAAGDEDHDPADIPEVVWEQWRQSVVKHGLQDEVLGRLAPSLQHMTRVIWNVPLGAYTERTLAEIRALRTHGEKRVRAILEVFRSVHGLVAGLGAQEHLAVRLAPRLIDGVERWTGAALQTPGVPGERELFECFVGPLLEQVRCDAAPQVVALAESRLGIHGPAGSVRQVARSMGLTRARVYQLLNEINDILVVRWPLGRHQSHQLQRKLDREAGTMAQPPDLTQFSAAVELFYPDARRGAAGPLEQAPAAREDAREALRELAGVA